MKLKIEKLSLYPIKSCGLISVPELQIGEAGPQLSVGSEKIGDREWMFVDNEGKFLTQRTFPKMALLQPKIEGSQFWLSVGSQQLEVPLTEQTSSRRLVSVWGKEVDAAVVPGPLSSAVSEFLRHPVSLVRFDSLSQREVLVKGRGLNAQTRFTDSQAYLILTVESLRDLNSRLSRAVDDLRFRGNILLSGAAKPYAEDEWSLLGNDQVDFESTKACSRCKVITVDPGSGTIVDSEPLVALAKYRKRETGVYFGQYFLSRSYGQSLQVGDYLEPGTG